jgi:periplasmic nitrate reductase NapD
VYTHKAQPPGVPAGELHVAGILVHAMPAHADSVAAWVSSLPGAFVHGAKDGKLVVTLEAPSTAAILDQLNRIRERASVLSALPVYQHNEPAGQIDEKDSYGY